MTELPAMKNMVPDTPEGETAGMAVAAQAQAAVQARYLIAIRNPRSIEVARQKIMEDCQRKRFAEAATYEKPVGNKTIPGLSVRFAEAAARAFGNLYVDTTTVFDDRDKRIIRVCVMDLEANLTSSKDVTIVKTVERSNPGSHEVVGQRKNTRGHNVFIVKATDDELLNKENAMIAKARRNLILEMIPADIREEAYDVAFQTIDTAIKADPKSYVRQIADNFMIKLNVSVDKLEAYLGCKMTEISPAQIDKLRGIYQAIASGETSWSDVIRSAKEQQVKKPEAPDVATAKNDPEKAKANMDKKQAARKPAPKKTKPKPRPKPKLAPAPANEEPDAGFAGDVAQWPAASKWTEAHDELAQVLETAGFAGPSAAAHLNELFDLGIDALKDLEEEDCVSLKGRLIEHLAPKEEPKAAPPGLSENHKLLAAHCANARKISQPDMKNLLELRVGRPLKTFSDLTEDEAGELLWGLEEDFQKGGEA